MKGLADVLLLLVIGLSIMLLATSRLQSCVRSVALQGIVLSILPIVFQARSPGGIGLHVALIALGTLLLKGLVIPWLVVRTMHEANVRREVEPWVSLHVSILIAAGLVGLSFWLSTVLVMPIPAPSPLLVPAAFSTLLLGFLVVVSRKKAITQVIGYLALENGVFLFGQCLLQETPLVVELGLLLDLFVGVFVFGIAIHHIQREFENVDTDEMTTLRDDRTSMMELLAAPRSDDT